MQVRSTILIQPVVFTNITITSFVVLAITQNTIQHSTNESECCCVGKGRKKVMSELLEGERDGDRTHPAALNYP